ncbi:MAG: glycosyltransferase family 9 protein [Bacteroidales bacterium]|nr:glycosyltransferase family 9 protein [Bacteroidales bacterium]
MAKLLVIRFSAFGDVAMTVPVIDSLARQYPDLQIVFLSRENFAPLFQYMPENVEFRGVNLAHYKGIKGLNRLYEELSKDSFDFLADFHDVLRTKFIRYRLKRKGVLVSVIDKGRKEKKALTRKNNKKLKPLSSTFNRYYTVLKNLSYPVSPSFKSLFENRKQDLSQIPIPELQQKKENEKWIGFAPFAKHKGKSYPSELMFQVIDQIDKENRKIILFGGGKEEITLFNEWKKKKPHLIIAAGTLSLTQELTLMAHLEGMVSMDSANMHLASLVNTPVISIWGATHPYCGFMGWRQKESNAIQMDLPCRPCSVFGNKPCYRKDYACLMEIPPSEIAKKIEYLIL